MSDRLDARGCITCGDEALRMRVREVREQDELALCEHAGGPVEVEIALVAPVRAGELLLVHGGTAIGRPSGAPEEP